MSNESKWMIYGAYGYTGELVVREALRKGHRPVLAGRNHEELRRLSSEEKLSAQIFALDDQIEPRLEDLDVVLHCAGPYSHTSRPMVDACLATGTHYLDITGEISVFESIMVRNEEAIAAGVSLIPGVGFDVVPTDCLAARLAEELPDATHLDLAFSSRRGGLSRGTLKTMIEGLGEGGAIRSDGEIRSVPFAWDVREIPYESGPRVSMTIPWGDVSTAFHTTGIPNVRVYSSTSPGMIRKMRRIRPLLGLAALPPVRWLLLKLADRQKGPDAAQRAQSWIDVWGEAWNDAGDRVTKTLRIPEGYSFTAASSVLAVEKLLGGDVPHGALTPARAFGSEFVDDVLERM